MRKDSFREFISHSPEESFNWAVLLSKELSLGNVITFTGDLGAGKTTLIKGIAWGFLSIDPRVVTSPTFTYLNIYENNALTLCHFDLYRLKTSDDFLSLGFHEYITPQTLCCIEWAEPLPLNYKAGSIDINLSYLEEGKRKITCEKI